VTVYSLLEQTLHVPWVIQAALLAAALLLGAGVVVRRQLATAGGGVLPDEGVTTRNVFEVIIHGLGNLARDTIGEDWRRYFPIVGTIFFFILIANLKGLIPGLGGATSDINTTVAWAIISFLVYNYVGIRKHGIWYVNQFLGPSFFEATIFGRHVHVRLLAPLFLPGSSPWRSVCWPTCSRTTPSWRCGSVWCRSRCRRSSWVWACSWPCSRPSSSRCSR
jgi:F0F1-type ATP synthase membrane subunit a